MPDYQIKHETEDRADQLQMESDYTPTFILTWNPKKYNWEEYPHLCNNSSFQPTQIDWACRSRQPRPESRFILIALGLREKNGIISCGRIDSSPYHCKTSESFGNRYVDITMEQIWDYRKDHILTSSLERAFPKQCWTPQMSGVRIRSEYLPGLWTMIGQFVFQHS